MDGAAELGRSGPLSKLNPIGSSTKYTDNESRFLYYGYRYYNHYNPTTGRCLSRDPLGEAGRANLYGFVYNDPLSKIDTDGREIGNICPKCGQYYVGTHVCGPPPPPSPNDPDDWYDPLQAAACFCKNYRDMRKANTVGADKYFHCLAHCCSAKKGAKQTAAILGLVREICDVCRNKSDNLLKEFVDSMSDMEANQHGLDCPKDKPCNDRCSKCRPKGLDPKY